MQPIEQACFWLARRAPRDHHPLDGAREADVAVVGAGLTGLWTALFLKAARARRSRSWSSSRGWRRTARAGATPGCCRRRSTTAHGLAIEHFGEAEARRLARAGRDERRRDDRVPRRARHPVRLRADRAADGGAHAGAPRGGASAPWRRPGGWASTRSTCSTGHAVQAEVHSPALPGRRRGDWAAASSIR